MSIADMPQPAELYFDFCEFLKNRYPTVKSEDLIEFFEHEIIHKVFKNHLTRDENDTRRQG